MHLPRFARLVVGLLALLALVPTSAAFAVQPLFQTFNVNDSFQVADCGSFVVIDHLVGTIKESTHLDNNGNVVLEITRYSLRDNFTNSVTGKTISNPTVGIDRVTTSQEGDQILAQIGLLTKVVVPGQGVVFARVGKLVTNLTTGEVIFQAGPFDTLSTFTSGVCSAVA